MTYRYWRSDILDWIDRNALWIIGTLLLAAIIIGYTIAPQGQANTLEIAGTVPARSWPAVADVTSGTSAHADPSPGPSGGDLVASATNPAVRLGNADQITATLPPPLAAFAHNDCRWIEDGLRSRGVRSDWVDFGIQTARRESFCCPNLQGGDRTNGVTCDVVTVAEWDHRSDTGAFQFNWVWWRGPGTELCDTFKVCTADAILADHQLQLDLFVHAISECGRGPWNIDDWYCRPAEVLS